MSDSAWPHRRQPPQAPPSLGFSRQEHWSGLPFPSPMHASESEVAQSCPTLSDPMDCSLLGPSIHGIFQARVLEWGATAFSKYFMLTPTYLHGICWPLLGIGFVKLEGPFRCVAWGLTTARTGLRTTWNITSMTQMFCGCTVWSSSS